MRRRIGCGERPPSATPLPLPGHRLPNPRAAPGLVAAPPSGRLTESPTFAPARCGPQTAEPAAARGSQREIDPRRPLCVATDCATSCASPGLGSGLEAGAETLAQPLQGGEGAAQQVSRNSLL